MQGKKCLWLNGQNPEIAQVFERFSTLERYLQLNINTQLEGWLVIDEFQYINKVSVMLKLLVDQHKKLNIYKNGQQVEHALVDVVTSKEYFIGSRAIWEIDNVSAVILTQAQPHNIGLSALGGYLDPLDPLEPEGLFLTLGGSGGSVLAPIAPGLIRQVPIAKASRIQPGEHISICKTPGIVALDGEREVEIGKRDYASVMLDLAGPLVVNLPRVMKLAAAHNLMVYDKELIQWL